MITVEDLQNGDTFFFKKSLKNLRSTENTVELFRRIKVKQSIFLLRISDGKVIEVFDKNDEVVKVK